VRLGVVELARWGSGNIGVTGQKGEWKRCIWVDQSRTGIAHYQKMVFFLIKLQLIRFSPLFIIHHSVLPSLL